MKYPILTGSQALQYYVKLATKPSDWDFINNQEKTFFSKDNQAIDIINSEEKLEPTNKTLFELSQKSKLIVDTPIGKAKVMPIELLKVMKISSLPQKKLKHKKHLDLLKEVKLNKDLIKLAKVRTFETENKIKKQFFNKYKVIRFFDHDELHLFVNKKPVYKSILDNSVKISKAKFLKLSFKKQKQVLLEEAFVLALERYLIPQVKNNFLLVNYLSNEFFKVDKNTDVSIYWLNKLCLPNGIKDHPVWLQKWSYAHYDELISELKPWWGKTFDNLPEEFWERLIND